MIFRRKKCEQPPCKYRNISLPKAIGIFIAFMVVMAFIKTWLEFMKRRCEEDSRSKKKHQPVQPKKKRSRPRPPIPMVALPPVSRQPLSSANVPRFGQQPPNIGEVQQSSSIPPRASIPLEASIPPSASIPPNALDQQGEYTVIQIPELAMVSGRNFDSPPEHTPAEPLPKYTLLDTTIPGYTAAEPLPKYSLFNLPISNHRLLS
ncbi:hypothetical protein EDC01DRAFT_168018 [Geopyxis carbonaria]|nr:hypothetical protein EDC01DRAFT_168018 [Geopyxis carbonaria]